jgi:predicted transcriptional regulator
VDRLAEETGESRSAIVRHSLEQTLRQQAEQQELHEARRIYAEIEAEDRQLAEDFLTVAAETLPVYQLLPEANR